MRNFDRIKLPYEDPLLFGLNDLFFFSLVAH